MNTVLPVVVIGAGPVGLAAAAHLRSRGFTPVVLEAADAVGAGIRRWSHVRMFSPWEYNIDRRAAELLAQHGWTPPDPTHFPTGRDIVDAYLQPLASTPELAPHIRLGARVTGVSKHYRDRMTNADRGNEPFVVRYEQAGDEYDIVAQAVIDASGTIETPNPLGAAGVPALGERAAQASIAYGLPDVLGAQRVRYAGKRVLVVGSGHSAFNVLTDLARLAAEAPDTVIHWAIRRPSLQHVLGGGENDQLKERGRLGLRIAQLVERGSLILHAGVHIDRVERTTDGLVAGSNGRALPAVDEIVGCTGFRPSLAILDEVRTDLDPGTQAPTALAPLIDPNLHSCGTVRPHGAVELAHPDANFYIVGMKSYGRAPTFLLLTGYEQVRSVVAAIAGDWEAARRVELTLPETGVCRTQFAEEPATSAAGCCGGPAPAGVDACCVRDAQAKADGASGCGCGTTDVVVAPVTLAPAVVAAKPASRCGTSCA
jgi:thioredoxin reductase